MGSLLLPPQSMRRRSKRWHGQRLHRALLRPEEHFSLRVFSLNSPGRVWMYRQLACVCVCGARFCAEAIVFYFVHLNSGLWRVQRSTAKRASGTHAYNPCRFRSCAEAEYVHTSTTPPHTHTPPSPPPVVLFLLSCSLPFLTCPMFYYYFMVGWSDGQQVSLRICARACLPACLPVCVSLSVWNPARL